jgi:hypothetical protein
MTDAVDSANDWVASIRPDLAPVSGTDPQWTPRADEAATLLAARLYGRRGSVQGVAAFQDAGVAYVARLDPDVSALLDLGPNQPSVTA